MAYLSFNKPSSHMKTLDYTGNASTNAVTGVGFAPAFSWFKSTSNTNSHAIFNTLMTTYSVSPSNAAAQYNASGDGFTSLDSDGFTFNGSGGGGGTNANNFSYRSWNFKGGSTTIPSGSTATVQSYSINPTAGIGVYKYTDALPAGKIIKHGLGKTPQFLMVKNTSMASTDWACYHSRIDGDLTQAGDYFIRLNTDAVKSNNSGYFHDTVTTSTDITLAADNPVGGSGNVCILFAFCNVDGFSRMGGYFGTNRSHGSFVYTGFKPALIMVKTTGVTGGWYMYNAHAGYNGARPYLQANATSTTDTNEGNFGIDFLANGFKIHGTNAGINADGGAIIYMAFAEHPLVSNNGKAATAI